MVGVLVLTVGCADGGSNSGRARLIEASAADYPEIYQFVERPREASLAACAGSGQVVVGLVDSSRGRAEFGVESATEFPQAIWTAEVVLVRSAVVTDDPTARWLSIDRSTPSDQRSEMENALGPSLAAFALAPRLPEHPSELAQSAASLAATVMTDDSDPAIPRTRAVIDNSVLGVGIDAAASTNGALLLEFGFGETGRVDEVGVDALSASDDVDGFGFVIDFDWSTDGSFVDEPQPDDVLPLGSANVQLRRSRTATECTIG